MRTKNILRSLVFATGALFLIFIQNHSAQVGLTIFHLVTVTLGAVGLTLAIVKKEKITVSQIVSPEGIALAMGLALLTLVSVKTFSVDEQLMYLRVFVSVFAILVAIAELNLARRAQKEDVLELRISAALGILTGIVFALVPLNALNAVGLFSAYLALSAVQRAVWAATPNKGEKKNNG